MDHLNFGPSVEILDTADVAVRDPATAEARVKLYEESRTGALAGGAAYSFSYLPLVYDKWENKHFVENVDKTIRDNLSNLSQGLKAQYNIIQAMISDL